MFKRSNLIAKYKVYAKSIKQLQDKAKTECSTKLGKKYENLSESVKNIVENNRNIASQYKVIHIAQSKLNNQVEKSKEKCVNLTQAFKKSSFSHTLTNTRLRCRIFAGAAIPFVKADSVASGYSQHDYNFLKQLGVIVEDANIPTSTHIFNNINNVPGNIPQTLPENAVSQNSVNTAMLSETDFPTSLYASENYTSIFDNMPEERNDLYTTITNTFRFSSEKSTQISSNELPPLESENLKNDTNNDYIVVESPGVEHVMPADTANETDVNAFGDMSEGVKGDGTMNELFVDVANAGNASSNIEHGDLTDMVETVLSSPIVTNLKNSIDNIVIEPIPEPPSAPDLAAEAASQLNALGESTFAALGLGGWTPVGIVQNCFEYLHVGLGIPWWEAIAIGTLVIRFAMFPLVIMAQRNAAKMNNHLPQMQVIQMKMTEARQSGNQMDVARYSQELMLFMKEKNLNPFKNMIVPLAQMPIFISFFMGLREMANVPVDSLRTGGMFWFTDLTVPDQFFALPIITSLTLWATIELGTDSARLSSQNLQTMKYVLRALPFVILPFTVNFPGAILCYWVSSNFISLAQVGFLKIPAVRDYFNIDPMLKHDVAKLPIKNKGFVGGLKDSWTNIKITKEIEERRRLDELQFQRAGKGPLVKTYKYDPTKQVKKATSTKSAIKNSA